MSKCLTLILVSGILFVACGDEAKVRDSSGTKPSQMQSQSSLQGNRTDVLHTADPSDGSCREWFGPIVQGVLKSPESTAKLQQQGMLLGPCPGSLQGHPIITRCDPIYVTTENGGIPFILTLYANRFSDPAEGEFVCRLMYAESKLQE